MNPRNDLRQISDIAHRLLNDWTRFAETYGDLVTTEGDHLGVHGGDHPDPVYAGAIANERWTETTTEIAEALGLMRSIERRVTGIATQHPETARVIDAAARAARCADPVCTDNAVKDGYCFRHWQTNRDGAA